MIGRKRKNNFAEWFLQPFIAKRGNGHKPDFVLLAVIGLLLFFGLIFLSSASSTLAFYKYQDTYRFVKQQITHGLLPGLFLFYLAIRINYDHYRKLAWLALFASFGLLLLVFFTSLSGDYSAQSWIILGGFSFQPAELVKLFLIIFLAAWFEKQGDNMKSLKSTTIPFVIIMGLISFLIIKQPDIGTLSIIGLTALAMYYVAGAKLTHLWSILSAGALAFIIMVKAAPYRMNRITAWLNPDIDPQGIGWQIKQSLIAVGSGGWLGLGLGASRQKSYLPQPANDSIFAVIAEEIGFLFVLAFIILFIILIHRGFQIVRKSNDNFAKLLAIGISTWMALQIFINIGGILKLMPLTGVPLPFISLGGTNLVVTLIAMGVLINISKFTNQR
ncbi:MAG: putative lipid II flippase FtsW [Candidatus Komeilibacteria bacterium]|jgi:cell division protein FtsW|nr:putative lipid II flippase FtsW [Candidatus Komeilibacteria bacterium]